MKRHPVTRAIAASLALLLLSQAAMADVAEAVWNGRRRAASQRLAALPALPAPAAISPHAMGIGADGRIALPALSSKEKGAAALLAALPANSGRITAAVPNRPVSAVVLIEDIHRNEEAQRNISSAVAALIKNGLADFVGLEGAATSIDLEPYRRFPFPAATTMAAEYFLTTGQISGPVHAALLARTSLPPILGLEVRELYDHNVDVVRRAEPLRAAVQAGLNSEAQRLEAEKKQTFPADLLHLDGVVSGYRKGTITLGDYLTALSAGDGTLPSSIVNFLKALELERSLSFPRVEEQRRDLMAALVARLPKPALEDLAATSIAYRLGKVGHADFYSRLERLCDAYGVKLAGFPAMRDYIRYVLLIDAVDATRLLRDASELEGRVVASRARTAAQRNLLAESQAIDLSLKLTSFSLTTSEWTTYKGLQRHRADLAPFEAFYRDAEKRDVAMVENFLSAMSRHKAKNGVFIAGGFHSSGIREQLLARNIACIQFTPRVTHVDVGAASKYLSVFTREKTDIERLFQGERLFLAQAPVATELEHLLPAAQVAARFHAAPSDEKTLRDWFTEVRRGSADVRDLSDVDGKVSVSSEETLGGKRTRILDRFTFGPNGKIIGLLSRVVRSGGGEFLRSLSERVESSFGRLKRFIAKPHLFSMGGPLAFFATMDHEAFRLLSGVAGALLVAAMVTGPPENSFRTSAPATPASAFLGAIGLESWATLSPDQLNTLKRVDAANGTYYTRRVALGTLPAAASEALRAQFGRSTRKVFGDIEEADFLHDDRGRIIAIVPLANEKMRRTIHIHESSRGLTQSDAAFLRDWVTEEDVHARYTDLGGTEAEWPRFLSNVREFTASDVDRPKPVPAGRLSPRSFYDAAIAMPSVESATRLVRSIKLSPILLIDAHFMPRQPGTASPGELRKEWVDHERESEKLSRIVDTQLLSYPENQYYAEPFPSADSRVRFGLLRSERRPTDAFAFIRIYTDDQGIQRAEISSLEAAAYDPSLSARRETRPKFEYLTQPVPPGERRIIVPVLPTVYNPGRHGVSLADRGYHESLLNIGSIYAKEMGRPLTRDRNRIFVNGAGSGADSVTAYFGWMTATGQKPFDPKSTAPDIQIWDINPFARANALYVGKLLGIPISVAAPDASAFHDLFVQNRPSFNPFLKTDKQSVNGTFESLHDDVSAATLARDARFYGEKIKPGTLGIIWDAEYWVGDGDLADAELRGSNWMPRDISKPQIPMVQTAFETAGEIVPTWEDRDKAAALPHPLEATVLHEQQLLTEEAVFVTWAIRAKEQGDMLTLTSTRDWAARRGYDPNGAFTEIAIASWREGRFFQHFMTGFLATHGQVTSAMRFGLGMIWVFAIGSAAIAYFTLGFDITKIWSTLLVGFTVFGAFWAGGIVGHATYNASARVFGWATLQMSSAKLRVVRSQIDLGYVVNMKGQFSELSSADQKLVIRELSILQRSAFRNVPSFAEWKSTLLGSEDIFILFDISRRVRGYLIADRRSTTQSKLEEVATDRTRDGQGTLLMSTYIETLPADVSDVKLVASETSAKFYRKYFRRNRIRYVETSPFNFLATINSPSALTRRDTREWAAARGYDPNGAFTEIAIASWREGRFFQHFMPGFLASHGQVTSGMRFGLGMIWVFAIGSAVITYFSLGLNITQFWSALLLGFTAFGAFWAGGIVGHASYNALARFLRWGPLTLPATVTYSNKIAIDDPAALAGWKQDTDEALRLGQFSERLSRLSKNYGLAFRFPSGELNSLMSGAPFTSIDPAMPLHDQEPPISVEDLYRLGIASQNLVLGNTTAETVRFNFVLVYGMIRARMDAYQLGNSDRNETVAKEILDRDPNLMTRLLNPRVTPPALHDDLFNMFDDDLRKLEINATPIQRTILERECARLLLDLGGRTRISHEAMAAGRYSYETSRVILLPEMNGLLPSDFLKSPRAFIEAQEQAPTETRFPDLDLIGRVGIPYQPLSPVIPGSDAGKIRRWRLTNGRMVYAKRVDFLRVRYPSEEIDVAARLEPLLQERDRRFHAQHFVGLVHDHGTFYLLSDGVEGKPITEDASVPAADVEAIASILEAQGVADPDGRARLKDILLSGDGTYHVIDLETIPYRYEQIGDKTPRREVPTDPIAVETERAFQGRLQPGRTPSFAGLLTLALSGRAVVRSVDLGAGAGDYMHEIESILRAALPSAEIRQSGTDSGILNPGQASQFPDNETFLRMAGTASMDLVSVNAAFPNERADMLRVADQLLRPDGLLLVTAGPTGYRVDIIPLLLRNGYTVALVAGLTDHPAYSIYEGDANLGTLIASKSQTPLFERLRGLGYGVTTMVNAPTIVAPAYQDLPPATKSKLAKHIFPKLAADLEKREGHLSESAVRAALVRVGARLRDTDDISALLEMFNRGRPAAPVPVAQPPVVAKPPIQRSEARAPEPPVLVRLRSRIDAQRRARAMARAPLHIPVPSEMNVYHVGRHTVYLLAEDHFDAHSLELLSTFFEQTFKTDEASRWFFLIEGAAAQRSVNQDLGLSPQLAVQVAGDLGIPVFDPIVNLASWRLVERVAELAALATPLALTRPETIGVLSWIAGGRLLSLQDPRMIAAALTSPMFWAGHISPMELLPLLDGVSGQFRTVQWQHAADALLTELFPRVSAELTPVEMARDFADPAVAGRTNILVVAGRTHRPEILAGLAPLQTGEADATIAANAGGGRTRIEHERFHEQGEFRIVLDDLTRTFAQRVRGPEQDLRDMVEAAGGIIPTVHGQVRIERDGILVVVDSRFRLDHAGRGRRAVYARNEMTARHELAELRAWISFALSEGFATQKDIEDGLLGQKIREWINRPGNQARGFEAADRFHALGVAAEKNFLADLTVGLMFAVEELTGLYARVAGRPVTARRSALESWLGQMVNENYSLTDVRIQTRMLIDRQLAILRSFTKSSDPLHGELMDAAQTFFESHGFPFHRPAVGISTVRDLGGRALYLDYFDTVALPPDADASNPVVITHEIVHAQGGYGGTALEEATVQYLAVRILLERSGNKSPTASDIALYHKTLLIDQANDFDSYATYHPGVVAIATLVEKVGLDALLNSFVNGRHDEVESRLPSPAPWRSLMYQQVPLKQGMVFLPSKISDMFWTAEAKPIEGEADAIISSGQMYPDFTIPTVPLSPGDIERYSSPRTARMFQDEGRTFTLRRLDPKKDLPLLRDWTVLLDKDTEWKKQWEAGHGPLMGIPMFSYIDDHTFGLVSSVNGKERLEGILGGQTAPDGYDNQKRRFTLHFEITQFEKFYRYLMSDPDTLRVADLLWDFMIKTVHESGDFTGGVEMNAVSPGSVKFAKARNLVSRRGGASVGMEQGAVGGAYMQRGLHDRFSLTAAPTSALPEDFTLPRITLSDADLAHYLSREMIARLKAEGRRLTLRRIDPVADQALLAKWKDEAAEDGEGRRRHPFSGEVPMFDEFDSFAVGLVSAANGDERLEGYMGGSVVPTGNAVGGDVPRLLRLSQMELYFRNIGKDRALAGVADILWDYLLKISLERNRFSDGIEFTAMTEGSKALAQRRRIPLNVGNSFWIHRPEIAALYAPDQLDLARRFNETRAALTLSDRAISIRSIPLLADGESYANVSVIHRGRTAVVSGRMGRAAAYRLNDAGQWQEVASSTKADDPLVSEDGKVVALTNRGGRGRVQLIRFDGEKVYRWTLGSDESLTTISENGRTFLEFISNPKFPLGLTANVRRIEGNTLVSLENNVNFPMGAFEHMTSADGRRFLAFGDDLHMHLYEILPDGQHTREMALRDPALAHLSRDGTIVVSEHADRSLSIYHVGSDDPILDLPRADGDTSESDLYKTLHPVYTEIPVDEGVMILTYPWDGGPMTLTRAIEETAGSIQVPFTEANFLGADGSTDGRTLAVNTRDNRVRVYRFQRGQLRQIGDPVPVLNAGRHLPYHLSQDGLTLAVVTEDKRGVVYRVDRESLRELGRTEPADGNFRSCDITTSGGEVRFYREGGSPMPVRFGVAAGRLDRADNEALPLPYHDLTWSMMVLAAKVKRNMAHRDLAPIPLGRPDLRSTVGGQDEADANGSALYDQLTAENSPVADETRRLRDEFEPPNATLTLPLLRRAAARLGLDPEGFTTEVIVAPIVEGGLLLHFIPFFPLFHKDRAWHQWVGMAIIYAFALGAGFHFDSTFAAWLAGMIGHALTNGLVRVGRANGWISYPEFERAKKMPAYEFLRAVGLEKWTVLIPEIRARLRRIKTKEGLLYVRRFALADLPEPAARILRAQFGDRTRAKLGSVDAVDFLHDERGRLMAIVPVPNAAMEQVHNVDEAMNRLNEALNTRGKNTNIGEAEAFGLYGQVGGPAAEWPAIWAKARGYAAAARPAATELVTGEILEQAIRESTYANDMRDLKIDLDLRPLYLTDAYFIPPQPGRVSDAAARRQWREHEKEAMHSARLMDSYFSRMPMRTYFRRPLVFPDPDDSDAATIAARPSRITNNGFALIHVTTNPDGRRVVKVSAVHPDVVEGETQPYGPGLSDVATAPKPGEYKVVIPVFPTVYNAGRSTIFAADEGYHRQLLRVGDVYNHMMGRKLTMENDRIFVNGVGPGTDAVTTYIGWMLGTGQEPFDPRAHAPQIDVWDINPFAVANAELTGRLLGISIKAKRPAADEFHDLLIQNRPAFNRRLRIDARQKDMPLEKFHDNITTESFLQDIRWYREKLRGGKTLAILWDAEYWEGEGDAEAARKRGDAYMPRIEGKEQLPTVQTTLEVGAVMLGEWANRRALARLPKVMRVVTLHIQPRLTKQTLYNTWAVKSLEPESGLTLPIVRRFAARMGIDPNGAITELVMAPVMEGAFPIHFLPFFPLLHGKHYYAQQWIGMALIYIFAGAALLLFGTGFNLDVSSILSLILGGVGGHVAANALDRWMGWGAKANARRETRDATPEKRLARAFVTFATGLANGQADSDALRALAGPVVQFNATEEGRYGGFSAGGATGLESIDEAVLQTEIRALMAAPNAPAALRTPATALRAARLFRMVLQGGAAPATERLPDGNLMFSSLDALGKALPRTSRERNRTLFVLGVESEKVRTDVARIAASANRDIQLIPRDDGFSVDGRLDFARVNETLTRPPAGVDLANVMLVLDGPELEALAPVLSSLPALQRLRYLALDELLNLAVPLRAEDLLGINLMSAALVGTQA